MVLLLAIDRNKNISITICKIMEKDKKKTSFFNFTIEIKIFMCYDYKEINWRVL